MRFITLATALLNLSLWTSAQCVIEHWSLQKRIDQSSLVVEGKVVSQVSVWDDDQKNIYTIHTIAPYRLFKGELPSGELKVVTMGGTVGLERHVAHPSLQLDPDAIGVFLLEYNSVRISTTGIMYQPVASTQSLIPYDLVEVRAYDGEKEYHSISHDLYEELENCTGIESTVVKPFDPEAKRKGVRQTAAPVISSMDLDTVSSGTGTLLTINGSNFGLGRGTHGKVGFKDANFGDGRFYHVYFDASYVSWSNSKIEVYVPTRAGTGKVQVVNNLQESGQSSSDLFIKWAHLNLTYIPSPGDTAFYPIQHVDMNGDGGYTWNMTSQFAGNVPAVQAMYRSLEEWRCGTLMNWKVGADTSLDQTASDDVNIVRFDDLSGNRLGTCWSRYSGCYNSIQDEFYWFVRELDIEFDSTYTWYYGEGNTPSGNYDFQSVATHELGHGHQLGHVRDNQKIMHYSIGPGQKKDDLHPFDVEGGDYVRTKSAASGTCNESAMEALNTGNCNITLPEVAFDISDTLPCPGDTVWFTNQTEGNNLTFSWHFGEDADPADTNTVGPHAVVYSAWGDKTVKLVVENSFGKDSMERSISVRTPIPAQPLNFAEGDTNCLGVNEYTVEDVEYAENYAWAISSGGSTQGSPLGKKLKVDWDTPGDHIVTVVATATCGNSPPQRDTIHILGDAVADFGVLEDGLNVEFTYNGEYAASYLWDFGDGSTDSVADPIHDFPDKGSYTVKLVVENQCGKDSVEQNLSLNFRAGIDELPSGYALYPNPIGSGEVLHFTQQVDGVELRDIQGKLLWSSDLHTDRYGLPELSEGSYVISVLLNDTVYNQKLFIRAR